ncbi:hypothetical protein METSCH_B06960 [Metschnikowia aff. pulcherrima]|uniref:Uncharacterized protein n=1 Tax=Metschnikowia aff. pulcherrima TaxID=2163413 RepID=A0A4V1AE01_9ASCO|nr:hypothetical protein METSCH_B06960 [Metschnikowia aff. pulcherrima]
MPIYPQNIGRNTTFVFHRIHRTFVRVVQDRISVSEYDGPSYRISDMYVVLGCTMQHWLTLSCLALTGPSKAASLNTNKIMIEYMIVSYNHNTTQNTEKNLQPIGKCRNLLTPLFQLSRSRQVLIDSVTLSINYRTRLHKASAAVGAVSKTKTAQKPQIAARP